MIASRPAITRAIRAPGTVSVPAATTSPAPPENDHTTIDNQLPSCILYLFRIREKRSYREGNFAVNE